MIFVVPGPPVPKARPRFTRSGHTYTPKATAEQEERIRLAFRAAGGVLLEGPLAVHIRAGMPIPKSVGKRDRETLFWHNKRPDADNLAKTVLDALNGEAYKDDGQVARLIVSKVYAENPRTEIEIIEL